MMKEWMKVVRNSWEREQGKNERAGLSKRHERACLSSIATALPQTQCNFPEYSRTYILVINPPLPQNHLRNLFLVKNLMWKSHSQAEIIFPKTVDFISKLHWALMKSMHHCDPMQLTHTCVFSWGRNRGLTVTVVKIRQPDALSLMDSVYELRWSLPEAGVNSFLRTYY